MEYMPQPLRVLVTGASRGIGRACAEAFAQAGHTVTAVARTGDQLASLKAACGEHVEVLVADLTEDLQLTGTYDVVVLNAAYFAPGGLLDTRDVFGESFTLNVLANHRLARQLLPAMRDRKSGHLLVIGSTSTDDTSPHMTAYAATKKALRALYEGWEQELIGSGVRTTLIAPGATLTSSWDGQELPPRMLAAAEVAALVYRAVTQGLTGRIVLRADQP
ncbi:putative oxidoreductase [Neolewinella maritima]|uniref:Oxidoreductase n=1 Tax=Neolewinella maritima TaxID=1383882 RepID=A0ABM9B371_9BACT|nr:SDR family oxidoreductase [Neolewinella maritima]CAH1001353.1 putative oxidoreductase [Neolewinella maritima]